MAIFIAINNDEQSSTVGRLPRCFIKTLWNWPLKLYLIWSLVIEYIILYMIWPFMKYMWNSCNHELKQRRTKTECFAGLIWFGLFLVPNSVYSTFFRFFEWFSVKLSNLNRIGEIEAKPNRFSIFQPFSKNEWLGFWKTELTKKTHELTNSAKTQTRFLEKPSQLSMSHFT